MNNFLQEVLDWSEVWALLIPLAVLLIKPRQPKQFRPVIIYLLLALVIDLLIDVSWKFRSSMPPWLQDNNFLYNVHSVVRFICFSTFFMLLRQPFNKLLQRAVPLLSIAFLVINFTLSERFIDANSFSSRLLAVEAGLILFYCLQYYLYKIKQEESNENQQANDWIVWGLSIYVIFNFPFFLLYKTLALNPATVAFSITMWNFHNVSFVILCIFIAKAFHVAGVK